MFSIEVVVGRLSLFLLLFSLLFAAVMPAIAIPDGTMVDDTVQPLAGSPNAIIPLTDTSLCVPIYHTLPEPLAVRVIDSSGLNVSDVEVNWTVVSAPSGSTYHELSSSKNMTNASGISKCWFTIGQLNGLYTVKASVGSLSVLFNITTTFEPEGFGWSTSEAGDLNGDGYADLIVGAPDTHAYKPESFTVYEGTGSTDIPFRNDPPGAADSCRIQFLYTSSEIARSGVIDKVRFQKATGTAGTFNDVRISLVHASGTSLGTTFANNYKTGEAPIEVFNRSQVQLSGSANSWIEFDVLNLFNYNGSDPLIVELTWDQEQANSNINIKQSFVMSNRMVYAWDADATTGTTVMDRFSFGLSMLAEQPNSGAAFIYYGNATPNSTLTSDISGMPLSRSNSFGSFGHWVSGGGDLNVDGYDDVVVGEPGHNNDRGAVHIYYGSPEGIGPHPNASMVGELQGDRFGTSHAIAGDVNGDSVDDLVVGAAGGGSMIKTIQDSGTNSDDVPFKNGETGCRAQFLFNSSTVDQRGVITKIFLQKDTSDSNRFDDLRIYLCHATVSDLTTTYSSNYKTGHQPLKVMDLTSLDLDGASGSWLEFDIDDTFYYNGTDNLLIEFRWRGDEDNEAIDIRFDDTTHYGRVYSWDDTDTTGSRDQKTPNLKLGFNTTGSGVSYIFGAKDMENHFSLSYQCNATSKGSVDDTGSNLQDLAINDGSYFDVDDQDTMFLDSFDTGGIGGTMVDAVLYVRYYAGSDYIQSNNITWALDGEPLQNTTIQPDETGGSSGILTTSFDLYAQGVDTIEKVNTLDISYFNDDDDGNDLHIDRLWIEINVTGWSTSSVANATIMTTEFNSSFGWSVDGAGDVNGDGLKDVIVGEPGADMAHIFFGHRSFIGLYYTMDANVSIVGATDEDLGWAVAGAGDINDDGLDDVIVGAPSNTSSTGAAYTFEGEFLKHASTLSTPLINLTSSDTANMTLTGSSAGDRFGYSVSTAGLFSSDNLHDVIIGAPNASINGSAYVFYGPSSLPVTLDASQADMERRGEDNWDGYGHSVSIAGDVSDDNFIELVVGAPMFSSDDEGRAYLWMTEVSVVPDKLVYVSGDDQSAMVDTDCAESIVFRALNETGVPVPGAKVNFTITTVPASATGHEFIGSGTIFEQVIANWTGHVSVELHVGTKVGNYLINVSGDNFTGTSGPTFNHTINATATVGSLDEITLTPNNIYPVNQEVPMGSTYGAYTAFAYDEFDNLNTTWSAVWATSDGRGTITGSGGTAATGFTCSYTAGMQLGYDNVTITSQLVPSKTNRSCVKVVYDVPDHLEYISGSGQSGTVGATLPNELLFQVVNGTGVPVAGVSVDFSFTTVPAGATGHRLVESGGTSYTDVSNATGIVNVSMVLGTRSGAYHLNVSSSELAGINGGTFDNTITITALPGGLASISLTPMNVYPTARSTVVGGAFTDYLALGYDAHGNVNLTWTPTWGTSDFRGTVLQTGGNAATGFIAKYTSTGSVGYDNITVSGLGENNLSCIKVVPGPGYSIEVVSGNNQQATVGSELLLPLKVRVKDIYSNPVGAGTKVYFNITTSGLNGDGQFKAGGTSAVVTTNAAGEASIAMVLDTKVGTNRINAEISPLISKAFIATGTAGSLMHLEIFPKTATLPVGSMLNLNLNGYDQYRNPAVLSGTVWSTDAGTLNNQTDNTCILAASQVPKVGALVTATVGSASNTSVIDIVAGPLYTITITPDPYTMYVGESHLFTAIGADRYDNIVQLTSTNWTTNAGTISSATNSRATLVAGNTPMANGYIRAIVGSISGEATITVLEEEVDVWITGHVPDIHMLEDSPPYYLFLGSYGRSRTTGELTWHIEGENNDLYVISGEYGDDDTLIITPRPNAFGNDLVTLVLEGQDGKGDQQPLWINITPVNDKPVLDVPPDLLVHYGVPYDFDYSPYCFDLESPKAELTLTVSQSIKGEFIQTSGLNVTYTYPEAFNGESIIVTLNLSDGEDTDERSIVVEVSDDYVPILDVNLPDIVMYEGEIKKNVFDLDDHFSDPDDDSIFFSYGDTHVVVTINEDNTVDVSSLGEWTGIDHITFRAIDPSGAIAEDTIKVHVLPLNDPPRISGVPDLVVHYDADYFFDLSPYITDVDNETFELRLFFLEYPVPLTNTYIRADDGNNLAMVVNYPESMLGTTHRTSIGVSDGLDIDSVVINVTVSDDWPPELTRPIPDVYFDEDTTLEDAFNINDHFFDRDKDTLFYTSGNKHITVDIGTDGSVDFSAPKDWFGYEMITFRGQDPAGALVEDLIMVTVLPVNDAPFLEVIPAQVWSGGTRKISLAGNLSDVDNELSELTITVDSDEPALEIYVSGTDIILFSDKELETTINITVSDGELTASRDVDVRVEMEKESADYSMLIPLIILILVLMLIIGLVIAFIAMRRYKGNHKVEMLFLIYRDGRMIFEAKDPKFEDLDGDLFAAMFDVVQSFINDSMSAGMEENEIGEFNQLQFGEKKIIIEKGENVHLVLLVSGQVGTKLPGEMKATVQKIEGTYDFLDSWKGNVTKFGDLEPLFGQYMTDMEVQKTKKTKFEK